MSYVFVFLFLILLQRVFPKRMCLFDGFVTVYHADFMVSSLAAITKFVCTFDIYVYIGIKDCRSAHTHQMKRTFPCAVRTTTTVYLIDKIL